MVSSKRKAKDSIETSTIDVKSKKKTKAEKLSPVKIKSENLALKKRNTKGLEVPKKQKFDKEILKKKLVVTSKESNEVSDVSKSSKQPSKNDNKDERSSNKRKWDSRKSAELKNVKPYTSIFVNLPDGVTEESELYKRLTKGSSNVYTKKTLILKYPSKEKAMFHDDRIRNLKANGESYYSIFFRTATDQTSTKSCLEGAGLIVSKIPYGVEAEDIDETFPTGQHKHFNKARKPELHGYCFIAFESASDVKKLIKSPPILAGKPTLLEVSRDTQKLMKRTSPMNEGKRTSTEENKNKLVVQKKNKKLEVKEDDEDEEDDDDEDDDDEEEDDEEEDDEEEDDEEEDDDDEEEEEEKE